MDEMHFGRGGVMGQRCGETVHGGGHGRRGGGSGLAFGKDKAVGGRGNEKIDFEAMFVAEIEKLGRKSGGHLGLGDFRGDKTFEHGAGEGGRGQARGRADAQQVASKPRIGQVEFRCLEQAFSRVPEIRRYEEDKSRHFQNV